MNDCFDSLGPSFRPNPSANLVGARKGQQKLRKCVQFLLVAGLLLMGTSAAFAEANPLLDTVKSLYGVPYKAGGTTKKGFDCSGFTRYVFEQFGVDLPHTSAGQYQLGQKVARKDLKPGDLVFFNTNGRSISHVGIYIGNNTFVHSESGRGIVKTKLTDPYYWGKRYVGATRIATPALNPANPAIVDANVKKKPAVQAASVPETKAQEKK